MLSDFVSLFFPNCCLICNNGLVKGERFICEVCQVELPKIDFTSPQSNFVIQKFYGKVPMQHALSYYKFNKQSHVQKMLHKLKYDNYPDLGVYLGEKFAIELNEADWLSEYDLLIPVPLHRSKLRRRGYNQSTKIAEGLASITGIPLVEEILERRIKTQTQTRKTRRQRWENVESIFTTSVQQLNQSCLIVDDVITTGATVESCAIELIKIGCPKIGCLSLAAAQ